MTEPTKSTLARRIHEDVIKGLCLRVYPSGARYNSAIRYIHSEEVPRLAVVFSDDQTVDVIPE